MWALIAVTLLTTLSQHVVARHLVLVTAASFNHLCPLLAMLESVQERAPHHPVIVYDLDTAPPYMEETWLARVHPKVELRRFRYSAHPSYFNISEHAGQYAWKPVIIKTVVDEFGRALWVDSGNRLTSKAAGLIEALANETGTGFFSPTSVGNPWQWVHMGTFAHFGLAKCCDESRAQTKPCCCCGGKADRCYECAAVPGRPQLRQTFPDEWLHRTMCNGALIGFARSGPGYDRVLVPWFECALDRGCIAPVYGRGRGSVSTRGNHRQDQAALTMLAHFADLSCYGDAQSAGFMLHHDKVNDNKLCRELVASGGAAKIPAHDRNPR